MCTPCNDADTAAAGLGLLVLGNISAVAPAMREATRASRRAFTCERKRLMYDSRGRLTAGCVVVVVAVGACCLCQLTPRGIWKGLLAYQRLTFPFGLAFSPLCCGTSHREREREREREMRTDRERESESVRGWEERASERDAESERTSV